MRVGARRCIASCSMHDLCPLLQHTRSLIYLYLLYCLMGKLGRYGMHYSAALGRDIKDEKIGALNSPALGEDGIACVGCVQ